MLGEQLVSTAVWYFVFCVINSIFMSSDMDEQEALSQLATSSTYGGGGKAEECCFWSSGVPMVLLWFYGLF